MLGVLTFFLICPFSLPAALFYYTFTGTDSGLAELSVDATTGQITSQRVIASGIPKPYKVVLSANGQRALVTSEEGTRAWIYALGSEPKLLSTLDLQAEVSEVRAIGNHALLAASEGLFHWIDLDQARIEKTWNAKAQLHPPGNKGEDILYLPGEKLALITFQKDSRKGKNFGSRLVLFDPAKIEARFDLPLPRNHPELHIAGNLKEQGPNPEIVFVSRATDTLILTLDLYGAVAFAKLSSALEGKWDNLDYIPTSADNTWGKTFPDRGLLFPSGGKDYLLISNASANGGLVLFDVAARKLVQTFPASAGCETPVLLPKLQRVVTCVSGKIKTRTDSKPTKEFQPESSLLVFDISEASKDLTIDRIPFDKPLVRILSIPENPSNFLLIGTGSTAPEWVTYDLENKKILDRKPSHGVINRLAGFVSSSVD